MPMLIAINKDYISRKLVINHWLLVIKTSEQYSELPIVLIPSPTSPIPFAICATTGSNLDKMVIQMKDRTNGRTDDRADGQDSRTYIRTERVNRGTAKRWDIKIFLQHPEVSFSDYETENVLRNYCTIFFGIDFGFVKDCQFFLDNYLRKNLIRSILQMNNTCLCIDFA